MGIERTDFYWLRQGFTMEAIATQLSVSHPTIVRDLKEFVHDEQTQPRTSARGRKGEGRMVVSSGIMSSREQSRREH